MKNTIYIDIDTDRDQPIRFSKPNGINEPVDFEESKLLVLNDITCLCESLLTLIELADQNGYSNKNGLVKVINERLNSIVQ